MEWGLTKGLAQDLQFDKKIDDLRYNEEMTKRIQAENAAKTALFTQDLDFNNAANPFDNNLVKSKMKSKIHDIGQFVTENPDWNTNVNKMMILKLKKRELKDDPDLIRGLAVDQQYKEYLKDMAEVAKNPERHDATAYDEIGKQFNNYFNTGNKIGDKTKGIDPPVYIKPRDFVDINDRWSDIGSKFGDKKTRSIKGGRNAYEEYANPVTLDQVAKQEYLQNQHQYDIEAGKQGLNPIEYIKNGIDANIPKKRDFGDYGLSDAMTMANLKRKWDKEDMNVPSGMSAYQEAFVKRKEGVVTPETLEQVYGSKPKNIIYSNKGDQKIDNTGNRIYYTGVHKWIEGKDRQGNPTHQKVVETYSYLPLEEAKQKGIIDDPFGFSGAGGTDYEVVPEWNKQAEITKREDAKGDDKPFVKIKSFMPVELNEAYAGAFDNQVHFAKSKLMAQSPNEQQSNIPEGDLNDWKAAGWSDSQIQQAAQQGKIKIR